MAKEFLSTLDFNFCHLIDIERIDIRVTVQIDDQMM
jgi:hypothetical protein